MGVSNVQNSDKVRDMQQWMSIAAHRNVEFELGAQQRLVCLVENVRSVQTWGIRGLQSLIWQVPIK